MAKAKEPVLSKRTAGLIEALEAEVAKGQDETDGSEETATSRKAAVEKARGALVKHLLKLEARAKLAPK